MGILMKQISPLQPAETMGFSHHATHSMPSTNFSSNNPLKPQLQCQFHIQSHAPILITPPKLIAYVIMDPKQQRKDIQSTSKARLAPVTDLIVKRD